MTGSWNYVIMHSTLGVLSMPQSPKDGADLRFLSPQPDTSLHCQTTEMRLVHYSMILFTLQATSRPACLTNDELELLNSSLFNGSELSSLAKLQTRLTSPATSATRVPCRPRPL